MDDTSKSKFYLSGTDVCWPQRYNQELQLELLKAVLNKNVEAAGNALAAGANINAQQIGNRNTCLHYAVSNGDEKMVKFLLEHEADPTLKNYDNEDARNVALMWFGRPELFKLISEKHKLFTEKKKEELALLESPNNSNGHRSIFLRIARAVFQRNGNGSGNPKPAPKNTSTK
ncbi:MAG: ankyrin repeat domain-containing protein [Candidatus Micrarchaeota archaeon]